jgi:hypothetical protein
MIVNPMMSLRGFTPGQRCDHRRWPRSGRNGCPCANDIASDNQPTVDSWPLRASNHEAAVVKLPLLLSIFTIFVDGGKCTVVEAVYRSTPMLPVARGGEPSGRKGRPYPDSVCLGSLRLPWVAMVALDRYGCLWIVAGEPHPSKIRHFRHDYILSVPYYCITNPEISTLLRM